MQKLPALTFKYTHSYRDGEKSSTIWSPVHPDLFADPTLTQGLGPSYYDINEKIDTFQLNATQHVKETDLALGLQYQTANLNDALYTTRYLTDPVPPTAAYVTDQQKTTYNLFDSKRLQRNLDQTQPALFDGLPVRRPEQRSFRRPDLWQWLLT